MKGEGVRYYHTTFIIEGVTYAFCGYYKTEDEALNVSKYKLQRKLGRRIISWKDINYKVKGGVMAKEKLTDEEIFEMFQKNNGTMRVSIIKYMKSLKKQEQCFSLLKRAYKHMMDTLQNHEPEDIDIITDTFIFINEIEKEDIDIINTFPPCAHTAKGTHLNQYLKKKLS